MSAKAKVKFSELTEGMVAYIIGNNDLLNLMSKILSEQELNKAIEATASESNIFFIIKFLVYKYLCLIKYYYTS